jgi:pimeloyl-ACP methyl ester carboxylesterase
MVWIIASACALAVLDATAATPDEEYALPGAMAISSIDVRSYGGRSQPVIDKDGALKGTMRVDQVLVRSFVPATESPRIPIVLVPGFALSSDIYLRTPDGREGWALQFLREGHPVYLVEPSRTSRAGLDTAAVNEHHQAGEEDASEEYRLFTWDQETAWRRFGFGPSLGTPFEDSQFAKDSYEELLAMFAEVAVPLVGGRRILDDSTPPTIAGVKALLDEIGKAVLLVHSASGVVAFELAKAQPDRVAAVVNIEPVGCPGSEADAFPAVPVLSIFGDHYEFREQMVRREAACERLVNTLVKREVPAKLISLPAMGVHGNSHLPMSELNSADIAEQIVSWLHRLP